MSLEVPVDASDYAQGFSAAPLGDRFKTAMFPTFCPMGSTAHVALASGKRRLLSDGDGGGGGDDGVTSSNEGGPESVSVGGHFNAPWGAGAASTTASASSAGWSTRRRVLTVPADSDVSLTSGFKYQSNFTADYNGTAGVGVAGVAQYTACCRFHIGFKCSGDAGDYDAAYEVRRCRLTPG